MRYLFAFSYDGGKFTGFQRGTGKRSVEDSIISVLDKYSIGENFRCCSRTDRGVSAIMNTSTLDSDSDAEDIIGILNSNLEDIYFYKYAGVDENFNVRRVQFKKYVYIMPEMDQFYSIRITDLKKFEGEHDFSNFCKLNGRNTKRSVIEIGESFDNHIRTVSFKAKGFLWNQIRFMVGYAMEKARDERTPDDPFSAEYKTRKLAPPGPLFLVEISYEGVEFKTVVKKSTRKRSEKAYMMALSDYFFNRAMLGRTDKDPLFK